MGRDTVPGFAMALRRLRLAAGLSVDALADKSGVNRSSIAKIERGERAPSLRVALDLADALGTSLYEMRGTDDPPTKDKPRGRPRKKPK